MSTLADSNLLQGKKIGVIVTYIVYPSLMEDFLSLADTHAKHTLQECRGCLRYDVISVSGSKVLFYELYDSSSSFNEHISSSYLAEFRHQRKLMIKTHETLVGTLFDF